MKLNPRKQAWNSNQKFKKPSILDIFRSTPKKAIFTSNEYDQNVFV